MRVVHVEAVPAVADRTNAVEPDVVDELESERITVFQILFVLFVLVRLLQVTVSACTDMSLSLLKRNEKRVCTPLATLATRIKDDCKQGKKKRKIVRHCLRKKQYASAAKFKNLLPFATRRFETTVRTRATAATHPSARDNSP